MGDGDGDDLFRVNFSVRFGPTVALAAGVLVALHIFVPPMREGLQFAALIMAAAAVAYGSHHVGGAIQRRVRQVQAERTVALLDRLNDESSVRLRVFIARRLARAEERTAKNALGAGSAAAELHSEIVKRKRLHRSVTRLLGSYDDVSIAVQMGQIDELTAHRALRASMSFHFRHLKPYVDQARLASGEFGLYAEGEKLIVSWEQGRLLSTGAAIRT